MFLFWVNFCTMATDFGGNLVKLLKSQNWILYMYIVLTMLHDSIITHDLFEFCRKGQSCSLIAELCCLSRVQNSLKQHHLSWGSGWRSPSLPVVVLSYPNLYFSPGGFTSPPSVTYKVRWLGNASWECAWLLQTSLFCFCRLLPCPLAACKWSLRDEEEGTRVLSI